MSNPVFEAQTAIFKALTSSSSFTSTGAALYDTPPDNSAYPYVCVDNTNVRKMNRHSKKGWGIYLTLGIYTNPGLLGSYQMENIYSAIDDVVNLNRFDLESSDLYMTKITEVGNSSIRNSEIYTKALTYDIIIFKD